MSGDCGMTPLKIFLDVEKHPLCSSTEDPMYPDKLHSLSAVGILTKGTDEGRPVVVLRVDLPDGQFVLAQTTLRLLNTAMITFRARYGEFLED